MSGSFFERWLTRVFFLGVFLFQYSSFQHTGSIGGLIFAFVLVVLAFLPAFFRNELRSHSTDGSFAYTIASTQWTFADAGIIIKPMFGKPMLLSWADIDFIAPIPAAEQVNGEWQEIRHDWADKVGIDTSRFQNWIEKYGSFTLRIVVKDRRAIIAKYNNWRSKHILKSWLRPMFGADDRALPDQSCITLEIQTRKSEVWRAFMDFFSRHSRFDLVITFD